MVSRFIVWLSTAMVLPAMAAAYARGAIQAAKLLPRETTKAEELDKASSGISPVPTSRPELAAMELLRRAQSMLPNTCGWYADYSSSYYSCGQLSASCINIGNIRGCCVGPTLSCASTFWTTCLPYSRIPAGFICSGRTRCCISTQYPECGAYIFSSSATPEISYTMYNCFLPNYGRSLPWQEYPAGIAASSVSSTRKSSSSSVTTVPPPPTTIGPVENTPPPTGAIVGGVIAGLALLVILVLGIFFLRRRKPAAQEDPQAAALAYQSGVYKEPPYSPTEQSAAFTPQPQYYSVNSQQVIGPAPPVYGQPYIPATSQGQRPSPPPLGGPTGTPGPSPSTETPLTSPASHRGLTGSPQLQTSIVNQPPALSEGDDVDTFPARSAEVEAVHPFGTRDNRAELEGWGQGRAGAK